LRRDAVAVARRPGVDREVAARASASCLHWPEAAHIEDGFRRRVAGEESAGRVS
jgi:hypothetical protein